MSVRRLAAASLVAGVLLAGCSDDAEPRFEEPSSSPSPSEPESPDAGQAQTPEEFIREWVKLDTEMQNTGEVDEYLAVSRSCEPCRAVATRVQQAFERGGHVKTDGWAVREVEAVPGRGRFRISGTASTVSIVEREGAREVQLPSGPITYDIIVRRTDSGWQVRDLLEIAT